MTLLIQYTLIFASVLMLVALGGCFAERSGVINIGLEGIMVIGALGGALVLKFMPVSVGAPVMVITTVIVSALFGLVFSLLLAVAAINFKADQTITGTAMNMLATAAAELVHAGGGAVPDRGLCGAVQDPLRSAAACLR